MSRAPSRGQVLAGGGAGGAAAGGGGGGAFGRDRLISRAVSIAQGRTRVQSPDGAEMMAIHAEPDSMAGPAKPLHLQPFSPDWVGAPGLTLSETGRLRQRSPDPYTAAGLYHTQVGVDPGYEERAKAMQARAGPGSAGALQWVAWRRARGRRESREGRSGWRGLVPQWRVLGPHAGGSGGARAAPGGAGAQLPLRAARRHPLAHAGARGAAARAGDIGGTGAGAAA